MKLIMKKALLFFCVAFASCNVFATLQYKVTNVVAHQRYPWNGKVDIDFTIDCSDSSAVFKVTVECKGSSKMKTIRNNDQGDVATSFKLKAGTHRVTWDADVDIPNVKWSNVSFVVFASLLSETETAEYLVIDLSGGTNATNYAVSTLSDVPAGGWTDEYKTTKLVLRRCPAGKDPLGRYTLTNDFYVGVFEVTQAQWCLVTGDNMDERFCYSDCRFTVGSMYPAWKLRYTNVRGAAAGTQWPSSSAVDADSFIGILRAKTGLAELDLPTAAQWEYACRAGTTTEFNTGDGEAAGNAAGWFNLLVCAEGATHYQSVGLKMVNAWGIYDMHGNARELSVEGCVCGGYASSSCEPGYPYGCEYTIQPITGRVCDSRIDYNSSYESYSSFCSGRIRYLLGNSAWFGIRLCRTIP